MKKILTWFGIMALLTTAALLLWYAIPCNHQSIAALKWFQFAQTTATFLLPPFIMAYILTKRPLSWLQLDKKPTSIIFGAILLMLIAMPSINLIADWNSRLTLPSFLAPIESWMQTQEQAAAELTKRFLCVSGVGALCINIGLIALLPALAEELTFRGFFQKIISGNNPSNVRVHISIWVTAILFSAIHMQFYGFVPRMLLGAMFGYMLVWTGNLWIPISMHFINNCVAVIAYWVFYQKGIDPESVETFGAGETAWLGWVSLGLTTFGIYACWRLSRTMSNASSRIS